jgi:hypothetical protein
MCCCGVQGFGTQAESTQLLASPRLSALNSCRSLELPAQQAVPSAATQAAAATEDPRHVYSRKSEESLALLQQWPHSRGALTLSPPRSLPTLGRASSRSTSASATPSLSTLAGEVSLAHTYLVNYSSASASDVAAYRRPSGESVSVTYRPQSSESGTMTHRPWSGESLSVAHRPSSSGTLLGGPHFGSCETSSESRSGRGLGVLAWPGRLDDAIRAGRLDSVGSSGLHTNLSLQMPTGSTVSTPVAFDTGTLAFNSTVDPGDIAAPCGRESSCDSQPSAAALATFRSPTGTGEQLKEAPLQLPALPTEASPQPAEASDGELTPDPSFVATEASALLVARSPAVSLVSPLQEEPSSAMLVACSPPASTAVVTEEASQANAAVAAFPPHSSSDRTVPIGVINATDLYWMQPGDAVGLTSSSFTPAAGSSLALEVSCNVLGISAVPGKGHMSPGRNSGNSHPGGVTLATVASPLPLAAEDALRGSLLPSPAHSLLRAPLISTTVDGLRSGSDAQQHSSLLRSPPSLPQVSRYLRGSMGAADSLEQIVALTSSLVLDSSGNPTACLRNQPRLPRTAFLSTEVKSSLLLSSMDPMTGSLSQGDVQRRDGNVLAAYMRAPPPQPIVQMGNLAHDEALMPLTEPAPPPVTDGSSPHSPTSVLASPVRLLRSWAPIAKTVSWTERE